MGQRRSLAESRPFPGNSRWCRAWLNSREVSGVGPSGVPSVPGKIPGGVTSCPTPVGQRAGVVLLRSFVYTRATRCSVYTRSNHRSVYTRSNRRFCLYQGVVYLYSHQRPWGGERLGGRYTPVERLRRRLRDCRREEHHLGDDTCCARLVSPISNTVGGWARRSKAAASITTRVSGRWALGSSGYTTPGLSLVASPASCVGLVICGLEGSPEKGLVQGCSREGEEKPDPELFTLVRVAVKSCLGSGWAGL